MDDVVPPNDLCENSILLELPSLNGGEQALELTGSTVNATNDYTNLCGENLSNEPTVWYRYSSASSSTTAAAKVVTVSTCTTQTNFDTALTVYMGASCSSLICIGGVDNDLECRLDETATNITQKHSAISWHAKPSEQYYILVHGSEPDHSGQFGLIVTETEPLSDEDDGEPNDTSAIPEVSSRFIVSIVMAMLLILVVYV